MKEENFVLGEVEDEVEDKNLDKLKEILEANKVTVAEKLEIEDEEAEKTKILAELKETLNMNLKYKETLQDQLNEIDDSQKRNEILQREIRMLSSLRGSYRPSNSKKYATILQKRTADVYFFTDKNGEQPPENEDSSKKEKVPTSIKSKKWSDHELKKLREGIHHLNQEYLTAQILKKYENNREKDSVQKLQQEIQEITKLTEEQLEESTENIDWDNLSKVHVPTRDGVACKQKWELELKQTNVSKTFSKTEDKEIINFATENEGHNWIEISEKLDRTPFQCFKRYQRSLNTKMLKSRWTEEEDKMLIDAIKLYGEKNWQQISNCLEGRTGQQCLHRWMKTLDPNIKRGRWTYEEDQRLTMAYHAYHSEESSNWIKIKEHVPGRTDVQCRERWCNILNPDLKNTPWTKEEDDLLKRTIEERGAGKWSQISEILYPRTDNQCWRRWKLLNQDQAKKYRKSILKKEKEMVKNFCGREKERPEITPEDFEGDEIEEPKRRKRVKPLIQKEEVSNPSFIPPLYNIGISLTPISQMTLHGLKRFDVPIDDVINLQEGKDKFVESILKEKIPNHPYNARSLFAFSNLFQYLYYEDDDFDYNLKEEMSDWENDFEEKREFTEKDNIQFIEKEFKVDKLEYLTPDILHSKDMSILNSSFQALFTPTFYNLMKITAEEKPNLLRKEQGPIIPFISPKKRVLEEEEKEENPKKK